VDVSFVSGYPGNDLKTMQSYAYAERRNAQGGWDVVATDRGPELSFLWNASPSLIDTELAQAGPSTAEVLWHIPANASAGTYRIRHEGVSRTSASQAPVPYTALSSPFQVNGTASDCP
jgi:neutral ceramidase